ncbi:MAG: MBL fold metallo-hydrolase [Calditrichaeota bacterium]|nr:MAG: MBL fold metallo-hydrolase [Calditrichota bacterium]
MQIGDYRITFMESGHVSLDGGAMFGVVPKTLWSRTNPADELNRILLAMRLLLIRYKDRLMVVDTGVGTKMSDKLKKIYNVDHSRYSLESGLRTAGIRAGDVTDVIVTHLHFDHIGGATYRDARGELQLTFPNATHHVQKKQWQWALNPTEKDGASFMPENFLPIEEHGRLNLIDGEGALFPGLELVVLNGHTPGMQALKISDGRETMFYCADLFPTAAHIPLPYIMGYDVYPLETLAEKKRLLPRAVEENWLLLFEHDPRHIAGRAGQNAKGFFLAEQTEL